MKVNKLVFKDKKWIVLDREDVRRSAFTIIFVFGDIDVVKRYNHFSLLKNIYPNASVVGCSTAGNILDSSVDEYEVVATAVSFERGFTQVFSTRLHENDMYQKTQTLVDSLEKENLKHIFLLVPGLINASDVVNALELENHSVTISGGLAADNYVFEDTYLFCNHQNGDDLLIVVGFYGDSIKTSVGCNTGWEEFGATRVVTKSEKNIVYEIDNEPAIELYKRYLGDKIDDLPNSSLRFPLSIKENIDAKNRIVLVMMDINSENALLYGGDIKEGSIVKLMKTNVTNLLKGAELSAKEIIHYNEKESLSLTLSCAARKSVLKQFAEEEIEIVTKNLPLNTQIIGFYSYGEIAPFSNDLSKALLHNQTMTITTIYED